MPLDLFSLLTSFVHDQSAASFVTRFLGIYKGKLAFEVGSRQTTIAPLSWIWGASLKQWKANRFFRIKCQVDILSLKTITTMSKLKCQWAPSLSQHSSSTWMNAQNLPRNRSLWKRPIYQQHLAICFLLSTACLFRWVISDPDSQVTQLVLTKGKESWTEMRFPFPQSLSTIKATSVTLCMITSSELYPCIPVLMTVTLFQGHSDAGSQRKWYFLVKFWSDGLELKLCGC